MSEHLVSLVGVLTFLGTPPTQPPSPPGIWGGGNVPMPSPPIANVPGAPGYQPPQGPPPGIWGGAPLPWPTPPIYYPPGIWGPTDPRPGWGLPGAPPVISGPPGPWPSPPIHLPEPGQPPTGGISQPPSVSAPAVGVPVEGYIVFVAGHGYVFVPKGVVPEVPTEPTEPPAVP